MAFTMGAWYEDIDTGAALTDITAIVDQHLTTNGDDIFVPDRLNNLGAVAVFGADLTQARFSTPTLREKLLLDVAPIEADTEPGSPYAMHKLFHNPMRLTPSEGARLAVINDGAAASHVQGMAWFMDKIDELPADKDIFTVRCTGTTTLVANTWNTVPLTFSQQLPAGRYAVAGMRAESAGCQAARLIMPGWSWRPGVLGRDAIGDLEDYDFRGGKLGNWGEFEHVFPPQAEFLSNVADTAECVWLDLVQVRKGVAGG